jgi:hypothetical protein
VGRVLKVEL